VIVDCDSLLGRGGAGGEMLGTALRLAGRVHVVLVILALAALACEPSARRYGDRFQVVLPMLAWGCAALNKSGTEFATRFAAMMVVVHGTKNMLGDAEINERPNGRGKGFPSGHTAAAAIGASALVHECIAAHPVAKGVVIMSAAFVGASRIDAGKHDIWQVLAGGLLGWAFDRGLRRQSRLRTTVINAAVRIRRVLEQSRRWAFDGFWASVSSIGLRNQKKVITALSFVFMIWLVTPARANWIIWHHGCAQSAAQGDLSISTSTDRSQKID
jgi:membrane-associated phospholipid phosphatase